MFNKARIKLTAYYVLMLACILAFFSVLLFGYATHNLRVNFQDTDIPEEIHTRVIHEASDDLLQSIVIADIVALVLAGGLSFVLAGSTLKPIQSALDAQEKFSAHASHELRTPLAVLKTDFEVFSNNKHKTVSDAEALTRRGLTEVNRMTDMVENLLILARSKNGSEALALADVDIARVLTSTVTKMHAAADAKHLQLKLHVEDSTSILGNAKLLEQLFTNLIQNAISYTENGKIDVLIKADTFVTVIIEDTGIGINQKDLREIFKPFYKADIARTATAAGVGLGLSIVREIVDKHKGTITIKSELGKGTIVTITFPLS